MEILINKLKELQQERHRYCLMSNVVPDGAFLLPSKEFVDKWVSKGLEDYNHSSRWFRVENESKIQLLEELIDLQT